MSPNLCGFYKDGKYYACFHESDVNSLIHFKNTMLVLDVEVAFTKQVEHCDFIVVKKEKKEGCQNNIIIYFVELKRSLKAKKESKTLIPNIISKAKNTFYWFKEDYNKIFDPNCSKKLVYIIVLGQAEYSNVQVNMDVLRYNPFSCIKEAGFHDCKIKESNSFIEF